MRKQNANHKNENVQVSMTGRKKNRIHGTRNVGFKVSIDRILSPGNMRRHTQA